MAGRTTNDHGFTIIELVVVVAAIALVVTPAAAAAFTFLRVVDDIDEKLEASHATQMTTRYLPSDLMSVDPGGVTTSGFAPTCGVIPDVLVLSWTDHATTPSTDFDAVYFREDGDLRRLLCVDTTATNEVTLARDVESVSVMVSADAVELSVQLRSTDADPGGLQYSISAARRT